MNSHSPRVPWHPGYYDNNMNYDCFSKYSLMFKVNLFKRPWLSTHSLTPFSFIFQMSAPVFLFNDLKWISSWLVRLLPKRFQALPKRYIQLVIMYYIAMYHFLMCIHLLNFTLSQDCLQKGWSINKAEVWEGSEFLTAQAKDKAELRIYTTLSKTLLWPITPQ